MTNEKRQLYLKNMMQRQRFGSRTKFVSKSMPQSFNQGLQMKGPGGCASGKCGMRKPNSEISDSSKNLNDGS